MLDEEFLGRYRVLEELLDAKYGGLQKASVSVVAMYLQDVESSPVRAKLDLCREVRNILSHSAEVSGQPVVMPAQALLLMLEEIIDYVQKPPLALQFATPHSQLLWADLGQRALEVMRAMEKRGFSHVPVLQKSELVGVFSMGSVFSYAMKDMGDKGISAEIRIRDFLPWLPIDQHSQECYDFMDERATYADCKALFERLKKNDKRLAAIFITADGDPKQPVLGMVTPWDILGQRA